MTPLYYWRQPLQIPPFYLRKTGRFAREIASLPADTPRDQEIQIKARMKYSDFYLLTEAVEIGAIDIWTDDGIYYEFHAGLRIFRVKRADGARFLTALINRQHSELLRVRRSEALQAPYSSTKMLSPYVARSVIMRGE